MEDETPAKSPRKRPPRVLQLPWEALREEWQTTNVSFASLARRHKVPTSTISRCAHSEGWVRDPEALRQDALENLEAVSGKPARPPLGVVKVLKAKPPKVPDSPEEVISARHIRVGRDLQDTGKAILSTIRAMFPDVEALADDEEAANLAMAKARVAQQFAALLNPQKETLASLAKAAADVIRAGVSLERVANGLERLSGGPRTGGDGRAVNVITNTSTVQTNNTQNIQLGEVGGPTPIPGLKMSAEVAHMVRDLARTLDAQKRKQIIDQQTGASE